MRVKPIVKRSNLLFLAFALIPFFGIGQDAETPYRIKTIVIDAGHGGKDPGNLGTGRYKTQEKHIALEVALKVGGYIEKQFPEIDVIYTRKTDVFIGLDGRTEIANNAKADLFLSIHCNAFPNPNSNGVETFVLGLHKNKENLQVAMKENSAIFLEDDYKTKYEGFDPNSAESIIALTIMQSAYLQQSLAISSYIQDQFRNRVGRKDRGVKQAGFLVLRKTTMPSILIELGFLTHAPEEDFLNTENGKAYMSSAIFRGFKEYKDMVEDPLPEGYVPENVSAETVVEKQAELDAGMEVIEQAKKDSIQKVLDQAKIKAVADSLEQRKQELLAQKQKREEEIAKKAAADKLAEEARKAKIQSKIDSLEQVKKDKIAAFEKEQAALKAQKEAEAKANEEARLAQEEKEQRELESKKEAKEWLEEIKEAKEKELANAKRQAAIDEEKKRLEEIKATKQRELEEAKAKQAAMDRSRSDSITAANLIREQTRIDSLAKVEQAKEQEATQALAKARETATTDSIAGMEQRRLVDVEDQRAIVQQQAKKAVQDSLAKAEEAKQLAIQDSILVVEVEKAAQLAARKKAIQDSISLAEKAKAAVTIDTEKAATPEEAELLFLQLRKKQLEERIAKLKGKNVKASTRESLEQKRVEEAKIIESEPVVVKEEEIEKGIVLKVQVVTSADPLPKNSPQLKGQDTWEYQQSGLYKYTVGGTDDFDEITKLQGELRNLGFKGAFVVAFKDGARIKVSEARALLNSSE